MLQAVVNTAIDGIITIDDRGVIETVNPAAVHMFGYVADELVSHHVSMIMPMVSVPFNATAAHV